MKTTRITRNLGGDRLGSGNKMKVSMHNYNRSTHDLSRAWRSSMNVGTLVPAFVELGLPGDTFQLEVEHIIRTMPTIGPLYGSFKFQCDFFACPVRLYNGLLHANATNLGLNMADAILPVLDIETTVYNPNIYTIDQKRSQIATDSLMKYLRQSGWMDVQFLPGQQNKVIQREIMAVPLLAYWDIYKNYYANKQEEKGVYICANPLQMSNLLLKFWTYPRAGGQFMFDTLKQNFEDKLESALPTGAIISGDTYQALEQQLQVGGSETIHFIGVGEYAKIERTTLQVVFTDGSVEDIQNVWQTITVESNGGITLENPGNTYYSKVIAGFGYMLGTSYQSNIELKTFDLENLDEVRWEILRNTGKGNKFKISQLNFEPFTDFIATDQNGENLFKYHQHGLAVKTYQADIFNNWLNTEWIDGVGGINEITSVKVDPNTMSFEIDALNLGYKIYNMLNRIAVGGGSTYDYYETVYSIEVMRKAESPIYIGGMSSEIVFEEVVSQAKTDGEPLGTLAGRGVTRAKKGGHIEFKSDEPYFIMGIASITPRIDYSEGNAWFNTDLQTVYDMHKPELDGIGFQDVLEEQAAWWGTYLNANNQITRKAIGKSPAWINYQTAVNETFGEFAEENKTMFMTLNRRYEYVEGYLPKGIADLTTYIDPRKYNYAFADTSLAAQNFWVQLGIKCISRRVMSANVMPNL